MEKFSFDHNGQTIFVEVGLYDPYSDITIMRLAGRKLIWLYFDGTEWNTWQAWTKRLFLDFKNANPGAFEVAAEICERRMKLRSFE